MKIQNSFSPKISDLGKSLSYEISSKVDSSSSCLKYERLVSRRSKNDKNQWAVYGGFDGFHELLDKITEVVEDIYTLDKSAATYLEF